MGYSLPDINFLNSIRDDIKRKIEDKINEIRYWVDLARSAIDLARNTILRQITDSIGALYFSVKNEIINAAINTANNIINVVNTVKYEFTNRVQDLKNAVVNYYYALQSKINEVKDSISNFYNNTKNTITSEFSHYKSLLSTTISIAKSSIENKIYDLEGKITGTVTKAYNDVKIYITDKINNAKTEITNAINTVKGAFNAGLEQTKVEIRSIIDSAKLILGSNIENLKNSFNNYKDIITGSLNAGLEQAKREVIAAKDKITLGIENVKKAITGEISDLQKSIRDEIDKAIKSVSDLITTIVNKTVEGLQPTIFGLNSAFEKLISNQYDSYDEFLADLDKIGSKEKVIDVIVKFSLAFGVITTAIPNVAQPYVENLVTLANMKAKPSLLSPPSLNAAIYRELGHRELLDTEYDKLGFQQWRQDILIEGARPLLNERDIQVLFLRGEISEQTHDKLMSKHGYTNESIQEIKKLYSIIPPVSDLITMSVREVFTPEIAEKFGQFEDFPEVFAKYAEMQGLSSDWAKKYWASHWGLPSATQGFMMLHRRIIEEKDVELLLRSLDVMPYWRNKLIQLSYDPYTRVDIRRMHKVGVLDENGIYEAYQDIGYNKERARKLTEFTILLNSTDAFINLDKLKKTIIETIVDAYTFNLMDKDSAVFRLQAIGLTLDESNFVLGSQSAKELIQKMLKSTLTLQKHYTKVIQDSYARRSISRSMAIDELTKYGIDEIDIISGLEAIDYEIEMNIKDKMLESVQELYTEFTIDKPKMYSLLSDFGFVDSEINQIFKELDILREMRVKKPSKTDLLKWYHQGVIDLDTLINELKGLGLHDKYVEWTILSIASETEE